MTIKELYELAVSLEIEDFELYARNYDGDFTDVFDLDYDKSLTEREIYLD